MTMTLVDLKEKLKREDEVSLLEQLEIESADIVEMFDDLIESKFDILCEVYEEEENEDN